MATAHEPLALKYRPLRFADLAGQERAADTLCASLQQQNLKHAYIFSGTRGVGKTSAARIFARAVNCLNLTEEGEPCNSCTACTSLLAGQSSDVFEIDAASYTKVDQTREVLAGVIYQPMSMRYKVYIIDEAHMLSKASFNALLKTLEEPPEHVLFVLATTEPDKILPTVRSRCQKFSFSALDRSTLANVMSNILDSEGIPWEQQAIDTLALEANGSARDGLSLMDQVVSSSGALTLEALTASLGLLDRNLMIQLLTALLQKQPDQVMTGLRSMFEAGVSTKILGRQLLEMLHDMVRVSAAGDPGDQHSVAVPKDCSLADLFRTCELVFQAYEKALRSPLPDARFEIALLRAASLSPLSDLLHGPARATTPPQASASAVPTSTGASSQPPTGAASKKPWAAPAEQVKTVADAEPAPVIPLPVHPSDKVAAVHAFKERALAHPAVRGLVDRFDATVVDVKDLSEK